MSSCPHLTSIHRSVQWNELRLVKVVILGCVLLTGLKYGLTNEKNRRISLVPSDICTAVVCGSSISTSSSLPLKLVLLGPEQYMNSLDSFATKSIPTNCIKCVSHKSIIHNSIIAPTSSHLPHTWTRFQQNSSNSSETSVSPLSPP